MAVKIQTVLQDSPAQKANIHAGETLISINSYEIYDILDYRFYETNSNLTIVIENEQHKKQTVMIHKGQYDSIGLEFETYLMDKQHSCHNKCIFCFIDQLPKGLRSSLYFKDDDSRLSFLFGNYITLTNLSGHEIDRIIMMHISPINVSVHTTNPELRCKMMGNRFAGEALKVLKKFAEADIKINCQLVLCPGINDGTELERSLNDLMTLGPSVQSIALVPVGLTKFRDDLYPLKPYDAEGAGQVIDTAQDFGDKFLKLYGSRVVYAADEFYLKAERPILPAEFYGDFDQLENGVGMMANLRQEFMDAMEGFDFPNIKRHVTIVTGTANYAFLNSLLDEIRIKCNNLICDVAAISNNFFGDTINVTGLVTGGDIIKQLSGKKLGDALILPKVMLRHEGDIFLDDVSLEDVSKALNIKIIPVANDGHELLDAIVGSDTIV